MPHAHSSDDQHGKVRRVPSAGTFDLPAEEAMRVDARAESVAGDAMLLIRVAGLHCQSCERRVGEALHAVRGVKEAEIDFNSGSASVLYDPRLTDPAALVEAVNESGYDVTGFQKMGA